MPDLSEFVSFIAERSRVRNLDLIEKDVMLHRILREVHASEPARRWTRRKWVRYERVLELFMACRFVRDEGRKMEGDVANRVRG